MALSSYSRNFPTENKKPGRILVIAPQPFYADRGTPIAVRSVLEALSERGDKIDLLTYPLGETIQLPGLCIFRIANVWRFRHVPIGFSIRKLLLDLVLVIAIFKRLRRGAYRSIHAVEESVFPAIIAARKYRIPVIYDMQSSLPEQLIKSQLFKWELAQYWLRRFERWAIQNSDAVACSVGLGPQVQSSCTAVKLCEWYFPATKAEVAAEEQQLLREQLSITSEQRVVLYTGTFEPYQGISMLLEAVPSILSKVSNTVFVLVGAGSRSDFSPDRIGAELVKKGTVKIIGRQSRALIKYYLAIADIVVSPRRYGHNLPLKIFDYMAAGKPIVATDISTHRTVLHESRAVLIKSTPCALSEAIIFLLQNPEEAKRLGNAAQIYAEQHLGWNAFRRQVWALHPPGHTLVETIVPEV